VPQRVEIAGRVVPNSAESCRRPVSEVLRAGVLYISLDVLFQTIVPSSICPFERVVVALGCEVLRRSQKRSLLMPSVTKKLFAAGLQKPVEVGLSDVVLLFRAHRDPFYSHTIGISTHPFRI
jgi:hypothetical protein